MFGIIHVMVKYFTKGVLKTDLDQLALSHEALPSLHLKHHLATTE